MLKTFNCLVGFCLIANEKKVPKIKKIFKKNFKPYVIGKILYGQKKVKLNEKVFW